MNINELNYSTVRILADMGTFKSTGTGFIIRFVEQFKEGKYLNVPCIVTNKHVIDGAKEITVRFHAGDGNGNRKSQCEFTVPTSLFFFHPNANVDLCAMPVAHLHLMAEEDDIMPLYYGVSMKQIPNSVEELNKYLPSEDVTIVGYPNGLWDEVNNFPISRKGTLATAPAVLYKGESQFLIDCAIYPGSSGSPVFSVKQLFNKETFQPFLSVKLLGVVFATYQHTVQGDFLIKDIPTSIDTLIPNHLGLVLNSLRIHELNEVISEHYADLKPEEIFDSLSIKKK
ncbi:S1 family peptidase [Rossellomorea arthrocnemi]|uniref:S1 family peptidase n=1 Tax=Rossellomorea arthrocnemi TaxID=2769542 RepID=UPI001917C762|nr:serine protease [Rossellomorea arthrocnemi]